MVSSPSTRAKVFISYSHADKEWLERLKRHLKPLIREGYLDCWDDTHIQPGDDWKQEIQNALDTAQVAVLLISADFFASDFIDENELPPLLVAAQAKGVRILPVILSASQFAWNPSLARFQTVNPPDRPLAKLLPAEQEEVFDRLARTIESVLNPQLASPRTSDTTIGSSFDVYAPFIREGPVEAERQKREKRRQGVLAKTAIGGAVALVIVVAVLGYQYREVNRELAGACSASAVYLAPHGRFTKEGEQWSEYDGHETLYATYRELHQDPKYIYIADMKRRGPNGQDFNIRIPKCGGMAEWSYSNPIVWKQLNIVQRGEAGNDPHG